MEKKYQCCRCPSKSEKVTIHEFFFGTANRKLSVKYKLQVPVCPACHNWAHNRNPTGGAVPERNEEQATYFCELLGLRYELLNIWVNTSDYKMLNMVSSMLDGALNKWLLK